MNINNKTIINLVGSIAGGVAGFFLVKKFVTKENIAQLSKVLKKSKDPQVFHNQKEKVMAMLEDSRKKFNEKNKFPTPHNKKAEIHNQNHNVKAFTKPNFN